MNLVLLGPPGAGKGTQAELLEKKLRVPHISTGNILRDAIKNKTPVGMEAKAFVDAGNLVPDEVIIGVIKERLSGKDCEAGYIFDGIPRTIVQAKTLDDQGVVIDVVLQIDVPDEEIVSRLSGRRACPECSMTYHVKSNPPKKDGICDSCGEKLIVRNDDDEKTVQNRLRAYHEQTAPLTEYYKAQGKLRTVRGREILTETTTAVFKALDLE